MAKLVAQPGEPRDPGTACQSYSSSASFERGSCPHPQYDAGLCIFHIPKANLTGTSVFDHFWGALWVLTTNQRRETGEGLLDCRGFRFPAEHRTKELDLALNGGTDLSQAEFLGSLQIIHADVGPLRLTRTVFNAQVLWMRVGLRGTLDASQASFKGEAAFEMSAFPAGANFKLAQFGGKCTFAHSRIEGDLSFEAATFAATLDLTGATVTGAVSMDFSRASDGMLLAGAQMQRLSMRHTTADQRVSFRPHGERACIVGELDAANVVPLKDAVVAFQNVSLARASFPGTNVEDFIFNDVTWLKRRGAFLGTRRCLASEATATTPEEIEQVAETYRQLVLNYESKRDYDAAEDFHIGEMEMRRRSRGTGIRGWLNGYGAYAVLSRYGASYWQALLALGLMIGVFATGFMFAGFQVARDVPTGEPPGINYDLGLPLRSEGPGFKTVASDFGRAALLSASIVTLQRARFYEPSGDAGRALFVVAWFALAGQTALVLLAVRRRFRR